jgi:hypothetical protein
MSGASFQLSNQTKKELKEKAKQKAKELAIEAREKLSKEYLEVVSNFYSEYEPTYYLRHFNNKYDERSLLKSGMGRTFEKYYKNSHDMVFSGGISISIDNMYDDYKDPQIDVLNSFLNGYHGRSSLGIWSSIDTYKHMLRYKDLLIADFSERLKI